MVTSGSVLGLGLGYLTAYLLSHLVGASSSFVLSVSLTFKELGMVAALILIGCGLTTIPSSGVFRQRVSALLRA
jgi:hypothetical protein